MSKVSKINTSSTSFLIPANDLLAVCNAREAKGTARYYLEGVFVESNQDNSGTVQLTATDGHVLLSKECSDIAFVNEDARATDTDGFIIDIDINEKAFKKKVVNELWLNGNTETGIIEFFDMPSDADIEGSEFIRVGVCEFEVIDGTYPNYKRVIPQPSNEPGSNPIVCFNADYIPKFTKAHKLVNGSHSKGISLIPSGGPQDPILIEFNGCSQLTGVLMPYKKEVQS